MPSTNLLSSKINRIQTELNRLENKRAKAADNEAAALKKANRASTTMRNAKQPATIRSKESEIRRENEKIQKAKKEQADLLTKISKKNKELNKAINELNKERKNEQDRLIKQQEQKITDYKENQILKSIQISDRQEQDKSKNQKEYDVFISHSSDDKDGYVDELAKALNDEGVTVWYDSESIPWGSSIRQEIDRGLAHSRYGIVIISPSFIKKDWTNYELDGILTKESASGNQMLLPIWHNITADEVQKFSFSLSNKLALNTSVNTISEIVKNVKNLLD